MMSNIELQSCKIIVQEIEKRDFVEWQDRRTALRK